MGKGDRKSRRGKIWSNSYGKSRSKKTNRQAQPKDKPKNDA